MHVRVCNALIARFYLITNFEKIAEEASAQLGYRVLKEKHKEPIVAILCNNDSN